ncbi:MAG TPA: hypothetical protein VGQ71_15060 [Terriglobales bacterium]|jgi:hypothetical protein|nr:hypothetical protein [Terriglobales bacterium]
MIEFHEEELLELTGTVYDLSLNAMAESASARLPKGWLRTFSALVAQLRAASHPCRARMVFDGFTVEDGSLVLEPRFPDRVVHGIIRKYRRKLACTCTRCGRPGHERWLGLSRVPLCATCYGLRMLQTEIKLLLQTLDTDEPRQKDVILEDNLSPRVRLLLTDSWRRLQPEGSATVVRCLSAAALEKEAPRLRSLMNELDKQLQGMHGIPPAEPGDFHAG